jgi:RHS repeat-associated protein
VAQYTNRFVYDGWNLLAILNPQSAAVQSFMWGLDLSGSEQGAGGVGGLLAVRDSSTINSQPSAHFLAYDGNGNVAALVNAASGAVSAKFEYAPFGEVLRSTGPMAKANPFRFSTKYQDDESDHLYYGYRSYNPSTGRWLNRDPIEEKGDLILYAFSHNNPVNYIDLFGLRMSRE